MIHVLHRRFANIPIEIIPVKVQGEGAAEAIVAALEFSNQRKDASVVVIARGGGSLEDLQAFNSESVVRAIFSSEIPVVSAIGHETDFTISDFVADLRAPTPSAAAELIVPVKAELEQKNKNLLLTLSHQLQRHLNYHRTKACSFSERLVDPKKRIVDLRIKIDDITSRLMRAFIFGFQRQFEQLCFRKKHLKSHNPLNRIHLAKVTIDKINFNLLKLIKILIDKYNWKIQNLTSRLNDLNPIEILKRGYSITQTIPEKEMVLDANQVNIGDHVKIVLSKGNLICRVERK